ncbi:MAG: PH domain-containing protein [Planctomycetes bacterium]|nr:PH domain-containing protein [Planctomycetota bacterium]
MFRNAPIFFITLCVLAFFGTLGKLGEYSALFPIIIIPLFAIWWLRCKYSSLEITNKRTIMRTGILSKTTNEVRHQDIRNIIVKQTFQQRIFGTGGLYVSSAGQSDMEIKFNGLTNPQKIADLIRSHQ